jgi:APA family basic amino acid/polyamine antiporter
VNDQHFVYGFHSQFNSLEARADDNMNEAVNEVRLKRVLSLPLLTAYGVGTMVGGGFYALLGRMAGHAGMTSVLAILISAGIALITACSFGELAARLPYSAGESRYVQEAFGRQWLSICIGWLVIATGTVSAAALSRAFVGFVQDLTFVPTWAGIVLIVTSLTAIAIWGIAESVLLVTVITVIEVAGLVWVLITNATAFGDLGNRFTEFIPDAAGETWSGIVMASVLAFYAFIGFEDMVNQAEEVKEPERNMPRAILMALGITTVLYVLVSSVALLSVPVQQLAESRTPLALLVGEGHWAKISITAISILAGINGALVQIVMSSRVAYGMSSHGMGPRALAVVHQRWRTPVRATILMGGIVLAFALWLPLETLARITSGIMLFNFSIVNGALVRIKWRSPERLVGIPVYPLWIPMLGCVLCAVLLLLQIWLLIRGIGP